MPRLWLMSLSDLWSRTGDNRAVGLWSWWLDHPAHTGGTGFLKAKTWINIASHFTAEPRKLWSYLAFRAQDFLCFPLRSPQELCWQCYLDYGDIGMLLLTGTVILIPPVTALSQVCVEGSCELQPIPRSLGECFLFAFTWLFLSLLRQKPNIKKLKDSGRKTE